MTLAQCQKLEPKYTCVMGKCVTSASGTMTLQQCQASTCQKPPNNDKSQTNGVVTGIIISGLILFAIGLFAVSMRRRTTAATTQQPQPTAPVQPVTNNAIAYLSHQH
jgi:hypothetical protein